MSDELLDAVGRRLDEAVLLVGADHRLLYANPAARLVLGLGETSVGCRLEEAVGDYRLSLMVRACLAGEGEISRELVDLGRDRHLVAQALPVHSAGDGGVALPGAVTVVLRDESRLRRLERIRRDFIANVSHELRTPIAAIQLLVETLEEGAILDPDVGPEFVHKIGLEVSQMAHMVSELLELSTIESGRRQDRRVPTAVATLFGAADRLQPLAEERHLSVSHHIDEGTPEVLGDALALEQMIRNLVHNAIKFTPAGGSIRLEAAGVEDGERVEIRVIDTGCGIPGEVRSRIFERFYKADKSRQRDGEGTGLGLAIARHTAEAHGGGISVESEVGRGSTFIVRLPAAQPG